MKLNFSIGLFLFFFTTISTLEASIHERIDRCEKSGGGECVYSILRELAGSRPVSDKCVCTTAKAEVSSECFMNYEYTLKIDGRSLKTGCGDDSDKAYVNCVSALKQHELCR